VRRRKLPKVLVMALLLYVAVVVVWMRWGATTAFHNSVSLSQDSRTSAAIAKRVAQSGAGEVVDLAQITDFDWDIVFFFTPYTPQSEVEQSLGLEWPDLGGSRIEIDEGDTLVVFMKDRTMVRWFDHPCDQGDFSALRLKGRNLARHQARFHIRREGAEAWPVVELAQTNVPGSTTTTSKPLND
jgi:hypothetical protein